MKHLFIVFILILALGSCGKADDDLKTVPNIALNKDALILEKGKTERLIAAFTPTETPNTGHTWSSSAPNVATIDETGLITAISQGESTITVTALDGRKTATCKLTVVDKIINVTGISLDQTETTIAVGDNLKLTETIKPDNATDKTVTWSSSDNQIALVDNQGNVQAITTGKVTITATTKDEEKTASCKITVADKGVQISKPEISAITSISAFITGTAKPLGVKIKEVGICYSTSPSPTIEDKKVILSGENISYTLNKLDPNTTYYVRIYAIVDDSAKYGDQTTFATKVTTEISVPNISALSTYTAHIEGTIATFGLQTEETGICYSTSSMPTINDTKIILSGNDIAYTLNELTPETTYYVRIYAKLNGEYYYGDQGEFTTWAIIKTHFEPTDIYENRIKLTSPALSGVTKLDICYGTSPNPKITDNITTANVNSDGKLHLDLTFLKSGTTYYIRTYSRINSKVEYHDDEISTQTIGYDFSISYKINGYQKYEIYESGIHFERFRLFLNFTYNIKPTGTYLVEIYDTPECYLMKTSNYSESIYIENGTGTFSFRKDRGTQGYSGANSYIYFSGATDIRFKNIENNIYYHYIVRASDWYVL